MTCGGGSKEGVSCKGPAPGDWILSPLNGFVDSKASLDSSVGEDNPVGNCPLLRNHPENTPPPPTCFLTWCRECVRAIAE